MIVVKLNAVILPEKGPLFLDKAQFVSAHWGRYVTPFFYFSIDTVIILVKTYYKQNHNILK